MSNVTLVQALDWVARVCLMFSILNAILPPYEVLDDFPKAQKYYKLTLALVRYFSADVRTKIMNLYPSFQTKDNPKMVDKKE